MAPWLGLRSGCRSAGWHGRVRRPSTFLLRPAIVAPPCGSVGIDSGAVARRRPCVSLRIARDSRPGGIASWVGGRPTAQGRGCGARGDAGRRRVAARLAWRAGPPRVGVGGGPAGHARRRGDRRSRIPMVGGRSDGAGGRSGRAGSAGRATRVARGNLRGRHIGVESRTPSGRRGGTRIVNRRTCSCLAFLGSASPRGPAPCRGGGDILVGWDAEQAMPGKNVVGRLGGPSAAAGCGGAPSTVRTVLHATSMARARGGHGW
jgi:hypothetical protein